MPDGKLSEKDISAEHFLTALVSLKDVVLQVNIWFVPLNFASNIMLEKLHNYCKSNFMV
jgi:hypothetical protein